MNLSARPAPPVADAGGEPPSTEDRPGDCLAIETGHGSGRVVLTLTGELSAYTTPVLRSALDEKRMSHVVIDLREVERIDASGLGFLVSVTESRRDRGALTGLVAGGGLQRLFGYTRLRRTAPVCETVDAAIGAMPETRT